MRPEMFRIAGEEWKIWDWEERHWSQELNPLRPGGDPVYRAKTDTTFALYDKSFFDPNDFFASVRVAGRFTCRHLPWYRNNMLPEEEEQFYRSTEKCSYYLGLGKR
jgi:hypothetical protein